MKLLIINYMALPLPPVKGGAVEYLVDAFLKYNEEKNLHNITLYSIYAKKAKSEAEKYKNTSFKYIEIKGIWNKTDRAVRHLINKYTHFYVGNTYITKVLKKEKNLNEYDAVIIENAPEFGLKIPKSYKNKLILHLHNDYLNSKTKNAKKISKLYDVIYTISDDLGNRVKAIDSSLNVKTLYNGVDLTKFKEDSVLRETVRKEYNIKDDDFVFMYCGRISSDKGVLELVEAFNKIKKENCKLIIVGGISYSKNETNEYFDKVKNIADKNVIFTGFIPYNKVHALYTACDVGVVPSICNDAFNLTVIEFCANSVPLIISDRGAMKELVDDKCAVIAKYDKDKFIHNIKECLEYMLSSDIKTMGEEAKKVSLNFSIDTYCKRFERLLSEINGEKI